MSQFQEKTEKPTGKRIADLRKKGDVAKSHDFNLYSTFFIALFIFITFQDLIKRNIFETFKYSLLLHNLEIDYNLIADFIKRFLVIFLPFGICVFIVSLISSTIPSGIVITKPKIHFDTINPIKNIRKLFSFEKLFDLVKGITKVIIIIFIIWKLFSKEFPSYFSSLNMSFQDAVLFMMKNIEKILITIAAILFLIGIIDLIYQIYTYKRRIRMTKQEVKDELKDMEGNTQVKGKIRRMMREFTKRNKISQVKEASVVITNPTHFAVALKYKPPIDRAPVVLAKGKDKVALKIIDIAYKNGIPVKRDPPLARSLYKMCEVGEEINPIFYRAVAIIISSIYKERKQNLVKNS